MSEVDRLLAHLHRGGTYAYLWVLPDRRSTWSPVDKLQLVPAGRYDVYFGVHPTVQIPPANSRGDAASPEWVRAQVPYIAAINCLFAEFDAAQFLNDKDRALAHVSGVAHRPSVLVDSGGGYHAYWLLRETFYLDSPDARERAMRIQQAWVEHVGGDPSAKDLARMLRLPGTTNYKYRPPRPVEFARVDFEHLHDLSELAHACHADRTRPRPLSRPDPGAQAAAKSGAFPASRVPEEAVAEARALLARLAKWRCDNYDAWVHVGMALSELGVAGLELWDTWSRGSPKYRQRDCGEKWLTFRPGEGLTLASLAYWANQDNPAAPKPPARDFGEKQGPLRWDERPVEHAFLAERRCGTP